MGKNLKKEIRRVDYAQLLGRCSLRALLIAQVERRTGWVKTVGCSFRLWGLAYQGAPVVEQDIELSWEG